jgi:hypothetical protein
MAHQSNVGKVTKANGAELTVTMDDGTEQKVVALGNRPVGVNSVGIVANGILM